MRCKLFNLVLAIRANHHQVNHAADHARTVFNGLCAAQLAVARGEVNHRSTQLVHAGFKAHTSARGCFLKNHGQGAVCQWLVFFVGFELGFDESSPLEQMRVLIGGEIGELQIMPKWQCLSICGH